MTVTPSDSGYATLLAKWQSEGSPACFERLGDHGGEFWRAINRAGGAPTFLLHYAAGPTDPGYNKSTENWRWGAQRSGYLVEMLDTGMEFRERREGELIIEMEKPPLDESVWDPS